MDAKNTCSACCKEADRVVQSQTGRCEYCSECAEDHQCVNCREHFDIGREILHDKEPWCEDCYHETFFTCDSCDGVHEQKDATEFDGQWLCEDCLDAETFICDGCNNRCPNENAIETREDDYRDICQDCYDARFSSCDNCGDAYFSDNLQYVNEGCYCQDCARDQCNHPMFLATTFKDNRFKRMVGVEIEFIAHDDPPDTKHWEVKNDGSLCSSDDAPGSGSELVTNPANGDKLFEIISKACRAISKVDGKVNKTCGLHVHLDMRDSTTVQRENIFNWWCIFERIFRGAVDDSRRRNDFCRTLEPHIFRFDFFSNGPRYMSLNATAFNKHRTFEIRLHGGTVNPIKIKNWCLLLLGFFDAFENMQLTPSDHKTFKKYTDRELLIALFQMVKVPLSLRKYIVARIMKFNQGAKDNKQTSFLQLAKKKGQKSCVAYQASLAVNQ